MEFMGGCLHEAIYRPLLSSFELTPTEASYNEHNDEDDLIESKEMTVIQYQLKL